MPVSISKLPEITNIKDDSFIMLTQDGKTKRTLCNQFVTEEEARLDEFSPVITTSKSMTSVGQGDNGDYSSSIHEGAFKDCMLHGRTLVNYNQEGYNRNEYVVPSAHEGQHITANNSIEGHVKSAILKGMTLVNLQPKATREAWGMIINDTQPPKYCAYGGFDKVLPKLKPSTKYLIKFNKVIDDKFYSTHFSQGTSQTGGIIKDYRIVTTNNVITDDETSIHIYNYPEAFSTREEMRDFVLDLHVMIIEYQEGMENWDIPYFEGMQSVRMPVLTTTGKNLFDISTWKTDVGRELTVNTNGFKIEGSRGWFVLPVEIGEQYVLKYFGNNSDNNDYGLEIYETDNPLSLPYAEWSLLAVTRFTNPATISASHVFTYTPKKKYLIVFHGSGRTINIEQIQLEKGAVATSYEPFKSNILTCNEEVELRKVGNVQDELNLLTGELTQSTKEINLTGANWSISGHEIFEGYTGFETYDFNDVVQHTTNETIICNCFKTKGVYSLSEEGIWSHRQGGAIRIRVKNERLESIDSNGFNKLLAQLNAKAIIPIKTTVKTVVLSDNVVYSYDEVTHYDCSSADGSLVPTLSIKNEVSYKAIIKPSTKYSVVFNRTKIGESLRVNLGGTEVGVSTSVVGKNIVSVTTPSTLSHELVKFIGTGNFIKDVQVVEGDIAGDEPYFTGMIDCKSPILSNVGKNLFTTSDKNITGTFGVEYSIDNNEVIVWKDELGWYNVRLDWFNLVPNQKYCLSYNTEIISGNPYALILIKNDKEETIYPDSNGCFISPDNGKVALRFYSGTDAMKGKIRYYNIQLEQVTKPTSYECYKSNILSCETYFDEITQSDKTIVLRSLPNGVCDTLNVETGEYVQRIGEVVLDGSGSWINYNKENFINVFSAYTALANGASPHILSTKSDTIPSRIGSTVSYYDEEGVYCRSDLLDNGVVYVKIKKEKLQTQDLDGLKQYLQQNPITVQYELETPIVKTVDVQGFPYAYKDGHVIVSSGSNEPSITPKVQYSVPTNRGAQITQNTKSLIRQGKLLDDIEGKINQIIEATINDSVMLMKLRNK